MVANAAPCTPMFEAKNKNRIQNDIGHRSNQHRKHACFGKPLRGNKRVHSQGQLHKHRTYGVNIHIADAIFDGIFTGAKRHEKIAVPNKKSGSKNN